MTSEPRDAAPPNDPEPDAGTTRDGTVAATTREAKGSVQEAIGKLIGDDAVTRQGAAEKRAGATQAEAQAPKPRRGATNSNSQQE